MYVYMYVCVYVCMHACMYVYIYIYIYIYISEVGTVIPTGKSYSFRSCVRASEAACARETMLFPRLGRGSFKRAPASSCRVVACPSLSCAKTTPLFCDVLLIDANRCKSMLDSAGQR